MMSIAHDFLHADDEPFSLYIEVRLFVHGAWQLYGNAGCDLPGAYGSRPAGDQPGWTLAASVLDENSGRLDCVWGGFAPRDVARVCAEVAGAAVHLDVEPKTGAFLLHTTDTAPPEFRAE